MKRQLQTLAAITAFAIPLAFAGIASAWHITSTCGDGQWTVGLPDESWADGTIAKFDFHLDRTGDEAYLARGQSTVAPADATFVFVTYSNTAEQTAGYRPEGCVAPPTTTTTVAPTTTLAPTTTMSSIAVVTLDTPAPAALLAVDVPPVPQPQGVLSAGGQTLPVTGGSDLLTLGAAVVLTAGLVMVVVARRRVA